MSRQFSMGAIRKLMEEETGDWPVMLFTLEHVAMAAPLYISSDPTQRLGEHEGRLVYGTVSRGTEFVYYPVSFALPTDEEGAPPSTTLMVDTTRT